MDRTDLDIRLARELEALSVPSAPPTLLPRVMAAVEAWMRRPWYQRAWFTWPLTLQLAACVLAVLLLVLMASLSPAAFASARHIVAPLVSPAAASAADLLREVGRVAMATLAVWDVLVRPLLAYAFPVVAAMCLACGILAVALNRVAYGKAFQS